MIITTSQNIEGKAVSEYLGVISAVQIQKTSFKSPIDFWTAGVSSVIEELKVRAIEIGADAVIAINIMPDTMQQVRAYGTAVKFLRL